MICHIFVLIYLKIKSNEVLVFRGVAIQFGSILIKKNVRTDEVGKNHKNE